MLNTDSLLTKGNRALRTHNYDDAIRSYLDSLRQQPGLANILVPNIGYANFKRQTKRRAGQQKAAVCGWDLTQHTPDRVYDLAQLCQTVAQVEIIGCVSPKFRREINTSNQNTTIPIRYFAVEDEGLFLNQALELVKTNPYDIVYLSKPKMPNIFIGILYKLIWEAKVLMDFDEEELETVETRTPSTFNDYIRRNSRLPSLTNLLGKEWTRIAGSLAKEFDGITVANATLQLRFG